MNPQFDKAVSGYVSVDNKASSAFGALVDFAHAVIKEVAGDSEAISSVLKNAINGQEREYRVSHPKLKEFPTAYRSAKSVISAAVKAGVSLVDADGAIRSKSELERLTKEGKEKKPAVVRFETLLTNAGNVFAEVDALDEVRQCKVLVAVLADMVMKAEASMLGAMHREKAAPTAEDEQMLKAA